MDERLARADGKTPGPLGAFVIFDSKSTTLENELRSIAECEGVRHVTLSIGAAPPRYQINPAAGVTVVIYAASRRGQPVTANFALRQADLDDARIEAIVTALSDVLPK